MPPKRLGHPSSRILIPLRDEGKKHEENANDVIFEISKLLVAERAKKVMFDGNHILRSPRRESKKINELNSAEQISAFAAILCGVPVEVQERILLHFDDHTAVEGEHVFLVLCEECPTFRHLCFVPLLAHWELPLMTYQTGSFMIDFPACGSKSVHPVAQELSKLHLGNMHQHWMCSQGEKCRLYDEKAGHAYRGYDIGGSKDSSVSKEINGQTVHFASCWECQKFDKHGNLASVEGKYASLGGINDMRRKVDERDMEADVKAKVERIIDEQEKKVREKYKVYSLRNASCTCAFRNVDGTFECTSKVGKFVKLATVLGHMRTGGSEFYDVVARIVNDNKDATCCISCAERLRPVKTETECTFLVNDHVDENGATLRCEGTYKNSRLVKVTTVQSQMPKDSPFCGAVAVAVEHNEDGWVCKGCVKSLVARECTFLVNNHLVENGATWRCAGTYKNSDFVKVTTVQSQMPKDSSFCGVVAVAVRHNRDGLVCRRCVNSLVARECTFLVNNHLVENGATLRCAGTYKSDFVKVTTVQSRMPKDSSFCGAVAVAVEHNEDGWVCGGCVNRLVARECTFLVNNHLVENGATWRCAGTYKNSDFVKVTTVQSRMPKDSSFCGAVAVAVEHNEDGWVCKGCALKLLQKLCTFRENDHADENGVKLKCGSKAETKFFKVAAIKIPAESTFKGVVAVVLGENSDALCCPHCHKRLVTLPPPPPPPVADFFRPRPSKKQKVSK